MICSEKLVFFYQKKADGEILRTECSGPDRFRVEVAFSARFILNAYWRIESFCCGNLPYIKDYEFNSIKGDLAVKFLITKGNDPEFNYWQNQFRKLIFLKKVIPQVDNESWKSKGRLAQKEDTIAIIN